MKRIRPKALLKMPLQVEFETGRVEKTIEEVLGFKKGTILKLENSRKDIIQVYINQKHFAKGKTLRKNGMMYVEISELLNK